jgi:4-amino-4-deoxy-L-arabinose transferase-like glycosyltransferase
MDRPLGVWRGAAIVGALLLVLLAWQLLRPRELYTGTNGAGSSGPALTVSAPQRACLSLAVPVGTGRLRVQAIAQGGLRAEVSPRGAIAVATRPAAGGFTTFDIAIARTASSPESTPAKLCLAPQGTVQLAGRPGAQPDAPPVIVDGRQADARVQVWFLPPAGERRSLAAALPDAVRRAALFRPGVVGPWTYWLLLALAAGLAPAAVVLLAREMRRGLRRPALVVAAVAFAASATWALIEPPLNAPDETEHVAYAQSVAEQGRAPDTQPSGRRLYSSELTTAFEDARVAGQIGQRQGRPPWLAADEKRWARRAADDPPRDDAGGYTTGAPYQPLYYAALAPAQLLGSGWSFWSRLTLMRLTSALLAALAAACVFALVRELLPNPRWPAFAAGLIYALHPMVSFMGGVVNNDVAVNAGAAAVLWLSVRALRRGLSPRLAAALGAVLVLTAVAKGSGLALWPAAALAVVLAVRRRPDMRAISALAATIVITGAAWASAAALLHRGDPLPTTPARLSANGNEFPTAPGGALPSPTRALHHPVAYATWLWELALPPAPGMRDLRPADSSTPGFVAYVERAWASFGMAAVQFPRWVYAAIALAMAAAGLAALLALRRHRHFARRRLPELAVLAVAALAVPLGVEAVFFATEPGGRIVPEFGRYYLPAAPALAAIAAASWFALGRRHAPVLAGATVAAMGGLYLASVLLAVTTFYA